MECNYEIGKIYDSIFYGIMYFHSNIILQKIDNCFLDHTKVESNFNEINTKLPALPSILSPIFLPVHHGSCALSSFFLEQFEFSNGTIDGFMCEIAAKTSLFRAHIASYLFSDIHTFSPQNMSPDALVNTILTSDYSQEFKLLISLLFGQFEYAINLLITYLRMIYVQVDILHQKEADAIKSVIERVHSEQNKELYDQFCMNHFSAEFKNDPSTFLSISFLHPYLCYFSIKSNQYRCILGLQHEKGIRFQTGEPIIELSEILHALGHDTRLAIINIFREYNELTAASVAKHLKMSPVTILRHMAILTESAILYHSRKDGIQIFYKLNYKILENAIEIANIYIKGGNQNVND